MYENSAAPYPKPRGEDMLRRIFSFIMVAVLLVVPVGAEPIRWVDFSVPYESLKYAMEQEAAAIRAKAEAEAAGIRAKGEAEAAAIQAKAEAEAAGIDKKAEAMQKYGEAAIIEMLCNMYPQVAQAVATPLSNIDKITMYGSGNTAKMTEDVTTSLKQVIDGIGDSLGINPAVLISSFAGTKLAGLGGNESADVEAAATQAIEKAAANVSAKESNSEEE